MNLSPLPCCRHLEGEPYRERIAELVEAIIAKSAVRRAETGIEPLGAAAILRQQPFSQPGKTKKSPAPLVHAASKRIRIETKVAYGWFARAFREAAAYLRVGDRMARFPRGSFPPGLPFVRAGRLAISPAT
ncbi:MAG TPA: hypothetical protein VGS22_15265 [Thermoanaerobaculia bacterium]|nr:hypothetical protein [Thermoanaerobaculia bacterium]